MKRRYLLAVILLAVLCFGACSQPQPTIGSKPTTKPSTNPTTSATQNTKPDSTPDCYKGHTFVDDSDFCTVCGENYYDVTLKFKISESREYYTVAGIGTCERSVVKIPEYHYDIPVIGIEKLAFAAEDPSTYEGNLCKNITEVILPPSIVEIGERAFICCSSLKQVTIPSGVTTIEKMAFSRCELLETVVLSEGLIKIGESAFSYCKALQNIVLPESLTTIEQNAFVCCESLEVLTIPKNVTTIGRTALSYCTKLRQLIFPENMTALSSGLLQGCAALESIRIPAGVTEVPNSFAKDCTSLKKVEIPEGVTKIADDAFVNCVSLTELQIPDSIKTIYDNVFEGCTALYQTCVYEGMAYVGNNANPYMILIGKSDSARMDVIFHPDTKMTLPYIFKQEIVTSLSINEKLDATLRGTLVGVKGLETIQVAPGNPNYHSAGNCLIETKTKTLLKGSKNSVIPDDGSVAIIAYEAFSNVSGMTYLVIPDAVTEIGDSAFADCADLETLVIGSGVGVIENEAFLRCDNITAVYYHGTQSQWEQMDIIGRDNNRGSNVNLLKATVYFYSETPPAEEGNYWRYVDGIPTPWKAEE